METEVFVDCPCSGHHAVVPRLMLGFMSGCAFLSMWVQNTSAVTMVMPIVEAVLQQILKTKERMCAGEDNPNLQLDGTRIYILFCYRGMCRHTLLSGTLLPMKCSCKKAV